MSLKVKIIAAVVFLLALGGALWLLEQHGYDRGMAACHAAQEKAAKADDTKHEAVVVAADAGMQKAVDAGQQQQAAAEQHTQTVIRTVTKVIHDTPSPAVCVVQPDSLRALTDAATRATAAADRLQRTPASPTAAASTGPAGP